MAFFFCFSWERQPLCSDWMCVIVLSLITEDMLDLALHSDLGFGLITAYHGLLMICNLVLTPPNLLLTKLDPSQHFPSSAIVLVGEETALADPAIAFQ